jgi:toxin ParE1/3/4
MKVNQLLAHPRVGQNDATNLIGRATRGYRALCRYVAVIDTVFVLAVRVQREDGFTLAP